MNLNYRLSRLVHGLAFKPGEKLFSSLGKVFGRLEQNNSRKTLSVLHKVEHASKVVLYGCHDCGDCSLPE